MTFNQNIESNPIEFPTSDAVSLELKTSQELVSQVGEYLAFLAKGLSAEFAVNLAGVVVMDFSTVSSIRHPTAFPIFRTNDGQLTSDDPILMQDLAIALARLRRAETQYICSNGIETVVVLRKVNISYGTFVLICPRREFRIEEKEVYEFGRVFGLTKAQCQILRDLCEGLAPDEVSSKQVISLSTVRTHIRNLLRKTKARDTRSLVCDVRNILTRHC